MHPTLMNTVMNAHIRDLQRSMWPERSSKRPRLGRRLPRRSSR